MSLKVAIQMDPIHNIDIIGEYLTEINITSPRGIHQINALNDVCLESQLWDAFEAKLNK